MDTTTVTAYYGDNQYGLHPMDYANRDEAPSALQAIRNAVEWGAAFVEVHAANGTIFGVRINDNGRSKVVYVQRAEAPAEPVQVVHAIAEPVQDDPYSDDEDDLTYSGRYCEHGTFVGNPYGPDYLCGYCEFGGTPATSSQRAQYLESLLKDFMEGIR